MSSVIPVFRYQNHRFPTDISSHSACSVVSRINTFLFEYSHKLEFPTFYLLFLSFSLPLVRPAGGGMLGGV